jgi:hypothetical protein
MINRQLKNIHYFYQAFKALSDRFILIRPVISIGHIRVNSLTSHCSLEHRDTEKSLKPFGNRLLVIILFIIYASDFNSATY